MMMTTPVRPMMAMVLEETNDPSGAISHKAPLEHGDSHVHISKGTLKST